MSDTESSGPTPLERADKLLKWYDPQLDDRDAFAAEIALQISEANSAMAAELDRLRALNKQMREALEDAERFIADRMASPEDDALWHKIGTALQAAEATDNG